MHKNKLFGSIEKPRIQSEKKRLTTSAEEKPAGQKEHFDKVLIPADHTGSNSPGMLEGQDSFQGRREESTTMPAEKGGRRNVDVDQKRRVDGADSRTAEL